MGGEQTKLVETKNESGEGEIGITTATTKNASVMTNENKRGRSDASDAETKVEGSKAETGKILLPC